MFKNEISRKFSYKGRKKIIVLLYPRNYVSEEGSHKNKKIGLEPRLVHEKETTRDMFNMPMNESFLVWLLIKTTIMFSRVSQTKSHQT